MTAVDWLAAGEHEVPAELLIERTASGHLLVEPLVNATVAATISRAPRATVGMPVSKPRTVRPPPCRRRRTW